MTLTTVLAWSIVRSLILAAIALPIARMIFRCGTAQAQCHSLCSGTRQRLVDLIENTPNFDQPQGASPGFWGVSAPRTGASALRLIKSTGRQDFRRAQGKSAESLDDFRYGYGESERPNASKSRRLLLAGALLPLFVPDLLVGFSYRLTAMKISDNWVTTEALYAALLLCRIVALQVLAFLILPGSSLNAESLHSWRLLPRRDLWWKLAYLRMLLLGPWRSGLIAFVASALVAFQEFETAALIQIDQHPISFPVWLFDAHAAGEPLSQSLRFIGGAMLCQIMLLVPLLVLIFSRGVRTVVEDRPARPGRIERSASGGVIALSCLTVLAWPLFTNLSLFAVGLTNAATLQNIGQRSGQMAYSVGCAATAAVLSLLLARWLLRRGRVIPLLISIVPGLCGALVLSLLLVAAFQWGPLRPIYDTSAPMVIGQTLLMLPRALLLTFLLRMHVSEESWHSAQLLRRIAKTLPNARWLMGLFGFGPWVFAVVDPVSSDTEGNADGWLQRVAHREVVGRGLMWQLRHRKTLAAIIVLTHWSLWEVTTASMLRAVRFEPVVTRLYNEMHYGRSESLVVMTFLTLFLLPVIWLLICAFEKFRRHYLLDSHPVEPWEE